MWRSSVLWLASHFSGDSSVHFPSLGNVLGPALLNPVHLEGKCCFILVKGQALSALLEMCEGASHETKRGRAPFSY